MQMAVGGRCKKCGTSLAGGSLAPPRLAPPPVAAPVTAMEPPPLNPYAPPSAPRGGVPLGGDGGLWRDGKIVVVSLHASFPDRCVQCNQPAGGFRLKRRLTWHPPGWYALVLFNLIVYAIVATIIQKKIQVEVGLCEAHRRRRRWLIGVGFALPLLGGVGCAAAADNPSAIWMGILGLVVGLTCLIVGTSILAAERIDDRFARIRGANLRFLESLPAFHP
jgi:hypothetical protein